MQSISPSVARRLTLLAAFTIVCAWHAASMAAPADLDTSFGSGLTSDKAPTAMAIQPDGKVVLGGKTFMVNGRARHGLIRLNADGTPDPYFQPETFPGMEVSAIAIQTDGMILAAGLISSSTSETPRPTVARYTHNGIKDFTFSSPVLHTDASPIIHLVYQPTTGIYFTESVKNASDDYCRIRRWNLGYSSQLYDDIHQIRSGSIHALVATDRPGKLIAVGNFKSGQFNAPWDVRPLPNIVLIKEDGTYDGTFVSGLEQLAGGEIYGATVQGDGNIILQGVMKFAGQSSRVQLARVLKNGGFDPSFAPLPVVTEPYGPMKMRLQANGKLILALPGNTPTDASWPGNLIRLNADGIRDESFAGNTTENVSALSLQLDGKLLIAGSFPSGVQRRLNDPGSGEHSLSAEGFLVWTQTGASAFPREVNFQFHHASGLLSSTRAVYLGNNVWRTQSPIIQDTGTYRINVLMPDGSQYFDTLPIGSPPSEIAIGGTTFFIDGISTANFGNNREGTSRIITFLMSNQGPGDLTGILVSIDGTDAEAFEIITHPVGTLRSLERAVFQIKFRRGVPGNYSANLKVFSNDSNESPFDIALKGTSTAWPETQMFTAANSNAITTDGFDATGLALGGVVLEFEPETSAAITVVNNTSDAPATGHFINLPDRSLIQALYAQGLGGAPLTLQIRYDGGDGNDIVLVPVTPAATDPGFTPPTDLSVVAIANQPDGKVLIGGYNSANAGRRILRMNLRGEVDASFNTGVGPDLDGIHCLAVLDDGKILAGGNFTTFDGVSRAKLVRLHANGSVDTAFQATGLSGTPLFLKILRSGKVLVAGSDGLGMKRLLADGTDDTTFLFHREDVPTYFDGLITSVVEADDDSLTAVGSYLYKHGSEPPEGMTILGLEHFQFEADGRLRGKLQFPPGYAMQACGILIQPDGRFILSGFGTHYLMRWKSNGDFDILDGTASYNFQQKPATLQADGSILSILSLDNFYGPFTVYKRHATGEQDSAFFSNVSPQMVITQLGILGSGHILCTGSNTPHNPQVNRQALLFNNAPTNHLHRTSQNAIRWKRGGGAPEADSVTFDASGDSGQTWTRLGQGSRAANGEWEITGATMPATGLIRARARVVGGRYNGSSGLVEYVQAYDSSAPELAVEAPDGADLQVASGFYNFGLVTQNAAVSRSFTLRNTIGGTLNVSAATTGGQQGDFVITTTPAASLTGVQSTVVTVTFTPATLGTRTTTLQITSNDTDESPFLVELAGTGVTAQQGWRYQHFNTANNTGDAADLADFDKDGLANLMEFAFDLDPKTGNATNGAAKLPEPVVEGEYLVIRFTPPAAGVAAGLTYGAQASATLAADSWMPVSNTGTGGVHEYKIPLAGALRFMKVTVNGGGN